jgi:hypothetical protein
LFIDARYSGVGTPKGHLASAIHGPLRGDQVVHEELGPVEIAPQWKFRGHKLERLSLGHRVQYK